MMAFALLEGLAITGFLVLLSAILPLGWLKDGFAFKGLVVIVVSMIASLGLQQFMVDDFPSPLLLLSSCLVPLLLMGFLIVFVQSRPKLQIFLSNIQDRLLIMLFIYVPLGLLSMVFVVVRYLS
jgi:hypothetical protein